MRKTEVVLGLIAGGAGIIVAVLSLTKVLSFLPEYSGGAGTGAIICLAANLIGIVGALTIHKNNIAGAVIMVLALTAVLFYGFPWQSLPAVIYIMSIVMAVVPVKAIAKDN